MCEYGGNGFSWIGFWAARLQLLTAEETEMKLKWQNSSFCTKRCRFQHKLKDIGQGVPDHPFRYNRHYCTRGYCHYHYWNKLLSSKQCHFDYSFILIEVYYNKSFLSLYLWFRGSILTDKEKLKNPTILARSFPSNLPHPYPITPPHTYAQART